jgi:hypothetical protein
MTTIFLTALRNLQPSGWVVEGDDAFENIKWHDSSVTPVSKDALDVEIVRIIALQENEKQIQEQAKSAALAKLERLGLSVDDIKLIMG